MLNLHLLECTLKGYDHISDLLLAKYWVITGCKYYGCISLREIIVENPIPLKYYPEHFCGMADGELDNDTDTDLLYCVRIKRLFTKKSRCFEGVDKKKCIIRVPKGSVELYKEAREWKEFENIVELWERLFFF